MHDHDAVTAGRSRMLVIAVASILLLSAIAHGDAYPMNDRPKYRAIARSTCYLSHSEQETNSTTSFANFTPQRQRQQRQKSLNRRPRNYWMDPENLRAELCDFWQKCGVPIETNGEQPQLPTIPNEVLLMHFGRNDLRAAISKNGGRETVSNLLGGTPIMRGRWREAVTSSPALQQLLRVDPSFSVDHPPRVLTSSAVASQGDGVAGTARWSHSDSRNRLGYWTLQTVIRELYERKQ
jgi:hypothetical protein